MLGRGRRDPGDVQRAEGGRLQVRRAGLCDSPAVGHGHRGEARALRSPGRLRRPREATRTGGSFWRSSAPSLATSGSQVASETGGLGGPGKHKNLAPFTYSMNSVHYHSSRSMSWRRLQPAGSPPTSQISYTVRAIPYPANGPAGRKRRASRSRAIAGFSRTHSHRPRRDLRGGLPGPRRRVDARPPVSKCDRDAQLRRRRGLGTVKAAVEDFIRRYVREVFPAGDRVSRALLRHRGRGRSGSGK